MTGNNTYSTDTNNTNDAKHSNRMAAGPSTIFMTGSTGFIGKETVKQLVAGDSQLLLLVRSESKARAVLHAYGVKDFSRITWIRGDLSVAGLALVAADRQRVLGADVIIHAGGTMDVTLDRRVAEQIFMNGAREVAELAGEIQRTRGLRHFIHVVGFMSPYGRNDVEPLPAVHAGSGDKLNGWRSVIGKAFTTESAYEHMKFEADRYIRQHAGQYSYALSVVNPSTVVGPYPTGATEQTGGVGMLVQAMRRRRMPVIPGGIQHWLPLVSNDVVAQTIVFLSGDNKPTGGTYPLLSKKGDSPDMKELIRMLAVELDVSAPRWSVPLPIIHAGMKAGGTRISGIPPESISFITRQEFEVDQTEQLFLRMGERMPSVIPLLPYVTADLDYRMSCPSQDQLSPDWTRTRKGSLAVLVHEGQGEPWIIVHGLMSGADDMLPLGQALWSTTGNPVWLVDLAGFGRSPVHRNRAPGMAFKGQVEAVRSVLDEVEGPVKLVGHSIGAAIAAVTMRESGRQDIKLAMLQPVWEASKDRFQGMASRLTRKILQGQLSRMTPQRVARQLKRADSSDMDATMLGDYAHKVSSCLKSPRIAGANADLLKWVQHPEQRIILADREAERALMIWGRADRSYSCPQDLPPSVERRELGYGHQFPIFHPTETVSLLVDWQNDGQ